MGESVHPTATLEVSVSFGRFQNDALSWEKWSSFSPNKYLEEVEKCSTPGSVAQKKAYFEAHYKKIAARKAELSEQEKPVDSSPTSYDEPEPNEHPKTTACATNGNGEIHFSSDERPAQVVKPEFSTVDSEKGKENNSTDVNSQDLTIEDETKEDRDATSTTAGSSDKEEPVEELTESQVGPESNVTEEFTEVQVQEGPAKESCPEVTEQQPLKVEEAKKAVRDRNKGQRPSARSNTQKITPRKKEQISTEERKKVASPATKSSSPAIKPSTAAKLSHFSAPSLSRSTMMPPSQASSKKANGSLLPKSKTTLGGYRKSVPTSLHMSLSLDPVNSGASFTTARKSLIMEKMGDKEIVRRAFKTFQNSINGLRSSTDGLFSGSQQVSYKESEKKVPHTLTPQKENDGRRKNTEKITQRGLFGNKANHLSMGSQKGPGVDKKFAYAASPSASLRSEAVGEKKKQDKSNMRGAERSQLSAKKKEGQEAQMKNFRQGISSKASSIPVVNRGKTMPKIPAEKEDKEKIHRQPTSER